MSARSRLLFDVMCVLGSSFGLLTGVVSIGGDLLYTIGALALVAIAGFFVVISTGDMIICLSEAVGPGLQRHLRKGTIQTTKRTGRKTAESVDVAPFFTRGQ